MNTHAGSLQHHGHDHDHHHHHQHSHGGTEGHITLEDVLALKFPHSMAYAPNGDGLAWIWNDGGATDLWRAGHNVPAQRVSAGGKVSSFSWSQSGQLAWVEDGRMVVDDTRIALGDTQLQTISWSPTGEWLVGIGNEPEVCVWSAKFGRSALAIDAAPGLLNVGPVAALRWSPDGSKLAVATKENGVRGLVVVDIDAAAVLWRYTERGFVTGFAWVDADRLHVTVDAPPHDRKHLIVMPASGSASVVLEETGLPVIAGAGAHACPVPPVASPDGSRILYTLYTDGWAHLHVLDVATGEINQITRGDFDDNASDRIGVPCWADNGQAIIYPSSRGDLKQRQLFRYAMDDGAITQVTIMPGTNYGAVRCPVSGQLAFLHSGPAESPDIWLLDADHRVPRQLTRSMPEIWSDQTAVAPMHVSIPSTGGVKVHGDLFLPDAFDPTRKYPVLVFVHGGTIDQMRFGWPPGSAYLGIYAWHQYLTKLGFAVLSVDYRGTTGYGLDYQAALWGKMGELDVDDCVAAATWLRSQPWVAHDRIGIWGISYGGYLTLAALTKSPGSFAAGISVAGVWDWELVREQRASADTCLSQTGEYRMTAGHTSPDEIAEAHWQASPCNFVDQLSDNLLVLHGTGDAKVTSDQMDRLIGACVRAGKTIEVMYYPEESHVFTKRETWRDAYRRMQEFLERRLVGHQLSCC